MDEKTLALAKLLLTRLERISVDSYWAHRASGARGSLLRAVEKTEKGCPVQQSELNQVLDLGFFILEQAAKEKS